MKIIRYFSTTYLEDTTMAKGSKVNKNGKKEYIGLTRVKHWESVRKEIIESPKNYNKLVPLINKLKEYVSDIENIEVKELRVLLYELLKVFQHFISKQLIRVRKNQTEQEQTVCKWLNSKYESYHEIIYQIWNLESKDDDENVITIKLDTLEHAFKLLVEESKYLKPSKNEPYFANVRYRNIIEQLLQVGKESNIAEDGTISEYLFDEFQENYFNKYWDLKFYFYQEFSNIKNLNSVIFSKFLTLTKQSQLYDLKDEESITELQLLVKTAPENTIYNLNLFKVNFEKAWIYGLNSNNELNKIELLATLTILHKRIIPYCSDAQKLMDFLTASYTLGLKNKDILISILALNGLWELMKNFNLDYPDFYKNLYRILTPELFHLKEKSRFIRLLEIFMSSTHLSSAIVASFIKRLSRLSLTSPPSGIILVVPFIYNLIKKYGHTTCILLIHSTTSKEEDNEYVDPYDENEEDPALTNAIDSSIWELETMVNHYHPNVSSLIKIFYQKFTKYNYNIEDFLDWSYEKLLETENSKNLKGELGIEFEKWAKMFDGEDAYMSDYLY